MSDGIAAIKAARQAGRIGEARQLIRAEIATAKGHVSSALADQWALTHMAAYEWEEARNLFLLLVAKHPEASKAWRNIGQCSEIMGDYVAAKEAFRKCVEVQQPNCEDECRGYFGVGAQLFRLGQNDAARRWWELGLEKRCDSADAHYQRSQILLALGRYEEGWQEFEWRKRLRGYNDGISARGGLPNLPEWDGRRIGQVHLVMSQGAGDMVQFARYIPEIRKRSQHKVHLDCGQPLRRFLPYERSIASDYVMHLDSAPHLLGLHKPIWPTVELESWTPPENPKPRIGVCWKGSDKHLNDKDRSCPFDFRPVLQDERWELVSLQNGHDFAPKDYLETAELMRTLDLVVTVDTSCAHVAGTLGVPTICIPPANPEWRWGLPNAEREATGAPWYPSVNLLWRRDVYDWSATLDRAKQRVEEIIYGMD